MAVMGINVKALLCLCFAGALWFYLAAGTAAAQGKSVLILHESESNLPAGVILGNAIREVLVSGISPSVTVYDEYLDLDRFPGPDHKIVMAEFLRKKYAKSHIDAVLATGNRALEFMLGHRRDLFPGASLTFDIVPTSWLAEYPPPPDVVGIVAHTDFAPTLELALQLQPDARQLVVVSGAGLQDQTVEALARKELDKYESRLRTIFLSGLPMKELVKEVGRLPRDTIVLYLTIYKDGAGQLFYPRDAAKILSDASSAPVYGLVETFLEKGIVGGHIDTYSAMGRAAGLLLQRILAGEHPTMEQLGVAGSSANYVNWLQLQRWGIDESRLPPGTMVKFKEPSLWTEYRWQIVTVFGLVAIQTLLLTALLIQAAGRRRAERDVKASEARMALAAESAKLGIWHWDASTREFWATNIFEEIMGFAPADNATFDQFFARVHPDDRPMARDAFEKALAGAEPLQMECRLVASDGATQWIIAAGRLTLGPTGKRARLMGIVADVTRRKLAEADAANQRAQLAHITRVSMLGELSGALAHELNQPLTAILSNAQAAQHFLAKEEPDLAEIRSIIADIVSDDIRAGEVIQQLRSLLKKQEVQYEPVDLNGVVAEVQRFVHSELIARNVRLITDLSPDLGRVAGSHVQLQQVFLNLLINSCDALQDGKLEDRTLTISTSPGDNGGVQVSFADNGPGIAAQMVDKLFEPFVSSKRLGLGLGLYVCQSIIQAHGGRLWASNNSDRGATFWIALPTAAGVDS
jgi:PAS domain S-box-containing protein